MSGATTSEVDVVEQAPDTYRSSRRGASAAFRPRMVMRRASPVTAFRFAIALCTIFVGLGDARAHGELGDLFPPEYFACASMFAATVILELEGTWGFLACVLAGEVAAAAYSFEASFGVSHLAGGWFAPVFVVASLVACTLGPAAWRRWRTRRIWNGDLIVAPLSQVFVGAWLLETAGWSFERSVVGEMLMVAGAVSLLGRFWIMPWGPDEDPAR